MNIVTPRALNLGATLEFCDTLAGVANDQCCTLDFSGLQFIEPFGLLYMSSRLRAFVATRRGVGIRLKGCDEGSYPAHMGFFQAIGADVGKEPGQATGSQAYLPITEIDLRHLKQRSMQASLVIQDLIEQDAMRLARILVQREDGQIVDTLRYCLTELFRNVVEHSEAPVIWYCAQFWPSREMVEVAVLDEGIGMLNSLNRNHLLEVRSDFAALELGMKPGVSGTNNSRTAPYDQWRNTGYGLYMIRRLAQDAGSLSLVSGSAGLSVGDTTQKIQLEHASPGTAVRLVLDSTRLGRLNDALRVYSSEADQQNQAPASRGRLQESASRSGRLK